MAASKITCPFLRMAGPKVVSAVTPSPILAALAQQCPHMTSAGLSTSSVLDHFHATAHAPNRSTTSHLSNPFSRESLVLLLPEEFLYSVPRSRSTAAPACNLPSKPSRPLSPQHLANTGSSAFNCSLPFPALAMLLLIFPNRTIQDGLCRSRRQNQGRGALPRLCGS